MDVLFLMQVTCDTDLWTQGDPHLQGGAAVQQELSGGAGLKSLLWIAGGPYSLTLD